MAIVQDHGLEVIRKAADVTDASTYSLRVKLPTETQDATINSSVILYELKSEIALLNKNMAAVVKHLSLITELDIEE
jgi:hypothetical protein